MELIFHQNKFKLVEFYIYFSKAWFRYRCIDINMSITRKRFFYERTSVYLGILPITKFNKIEIYDMFYLSFNHMGLLRLLYPSTDNSLYRGLLRLLYPSTENSLYRGLLRLLYPSTDNSLYRGLLRLLYPSTENSLYRGLLRLLYPSTENSPYRGLLRLLYPSTENSGREMSVDG